MKKPLRDGVIIFIIGILFIFFGGTSSSDLINYPSLIIAKFRQEPITGIGASLVATSFVVFCIFFS